MLQFDHVLFATDVSVVDRRDSIYKVTLEGQHYVELGVTIPLAVQGQGVIDLATPTEIVMNEYGTTIRFRKLNVVQRHLLSAKDLAVIGKAFQMGGGNYGGEMRRTDSDTQRTGMDAATRMMLGADRSARQIARGDEDDDDRGGMSLTDMMRRSNPGMTFFDEDD